MVQNLDIPQDQVQHLTQQLYLAHGTTMAGLAAQGYCIDFEDWHENVHGSLDLQRLLHSQPATRQALQEMCVQQHILTNADAKHTAACLTQMGLTGCFQVGGVWVGEKQQVGAICVGYMVQLQQHSSAAGHTCFADASGFGAVVLCSPTSLLRLARPCCCCSWR
jgi:hypothetical protein